MQSSCVNATLQHVDFQWLRTIFIFFFTFSLLCWRSIGIVAPLPVSNSTPNQPRKMQVTTITNQFSGYDKTLHTHGLPAISTLKRHLRASKAQGCRSVTRILTNVDETGAGDDVEVTKCGDVYINGRPA